MAYQANDIAKYFIKKSIPGTPQNITNLKLQKILYYAQGFYHATNNNEKLFDEEIQAWLHGPVVPAVYHKYKRYNYREIPNDVEAPEELDNRTKLFLDGIWELFKNFSGKVLEAKTHDETPWKTARNGLEEYEYSSDEIPVEEISNYFKKHYLKAVAT